MSVCIVYVLGKAYGRVNMDGIRSIHVNILECVRAKGEKREFLKIVSGVR